MIKSQYYPTKAFMCKGQDCNDGAHECIHPKLIELLDELHDLAGMNLKLGDVYRCPKYNAKLGKPSNSLHVQGKAAVVYVPNNLTLEELVSYCKQLPFDGIGAFKREDQSYVEVDVRNGGIGSKVYWEG